MNINNILTVVNRFSVTTLLTNDFIFRNGKQMMAVD